MSRNLELQALQYYLTSIKIVVWFPSEATCPLATLTIAVVAFLFDSQVRGLLQVISDVKFLIVVHSLRRAQPKQARVTIRASAIAIHVHHLL